MNNNSATKSFDLAMQNLNYINFSLYSVMPLEKHIVTFGDTQINKIIVDYLTSFICFIYNKDSFFYNKLNPS